MGNANLELLYTELKKLRRTVKLEGDKIIYKTKHRSYIACCNGAYYNIYTVSKGYKVDNISKSFSAAVGIFECLVGIR